MADASGATSSFVTFAITGTNDAPDITVRSGDSATANLTETGAGLTTSGTLTVRDPDLTDTVTASVTAVTLSGTTGGLTAADVLGMLSLTPGLLAADPGRHEQPWLGVQFRRAGVQLPERGRDADACLHGAGDRWQRLRRTNRDGHHQRHRRGAGGERRHHSGVQPNDGGHPVERAPCQ